MRPSKYSLHQTSLSLRCFLLTSDSGTPLFSRHRTLAAFLNTTFIVLSPLLTTLIWFRYSPLHLFFTYLIPLVPMYFTMDGHVSCICGRTPEELSNLLNRQSDLNFREWTSMSGEKMVLPPFGMMY